MRLLGDDPGLFLSLLLCLLMCPVFMAKLETWCAGEVVEQGRLDGDADRHPQLALWPVLAVLSQP